MLCHYHLPLPSLLVAQPNIYSLSFCPDLTQHINNVEWNFVTSRKFSFFLFLKILYIYFQREGKRGRKREKHQCVFASHMRPPLGTWPATQACALTGNRTSDSLAPRLAFNPLKDTSQGGNFLKRQLGVPFDLFCHVFVSETLKQRQSLNNFFFCFMHSLGSLGQRYLSGVNAMLTAVCVGGKQDPFLSLRNTFNM